MAQSLAKVSIHLIFSTKERRPLISRAIRGELLAYLVGIAKTMDSPAILAGGTADRVHVLHALARTRTIAEVVEELKKGSSKWIKTKGPEFRDFYWQSGYGAFSVSESNLEQVRQYVAAQEEHHRTVTFQGEYRQFLRRHGIAYDERYVWD